MESNMMQVMDLEMEHELDVECPRCFEIMSAEDGVSCWSEKCEQFRAWAEEHQSDPEGDMVAHQ
jgi:hypothetical protein